MKASVQCFNLIREFEGFVDHIYRCPGGKPTIGYGHVINPKLIKLLQASPPITRQKAEQLLQTDIKEAEQAINSSVKVNLTQGQFDALVSLIYNWGVFNFKASKGLIKLNTGDYNGASDEFFGKVRGVVSVNGKFSSGLFKRRQAELELWES